MEIYDTHHIVPVSTYLVVFAALMVLLILTLGAAMVDLPGPGNIIVAVTIAMIKALIVVLYFMHVRYSSRLVQVFAGAAFFWLLILFALTMADYATRGWTEPVR
ncbi:MAG: cytochrome C oxidase subunit IV family protein [Armatimonadetes bacterium]|nr:cytochrome C oxidase subunit IV family protein [Armatimonadota bacterium]